MNRIIETQEIHNAVIAVLIALAPDQRTRTAALVKVVTLESSKAALMHRRSPAEEWQIEEIYTCDHHRPWAVGVYLLGAWEWTGSPAR